MEFYHLFNLTIMLHTLLIFIIFGQTAVRIVNKMSPSNSTNKNTLPQTRVTWRKCLLGKMALTFWPEASLTNTKLTITIFFDKTIAQNYHLLLKILSADLRNMPTEHSTAIFVS